MGKNVAKTQILHDFQIYEDVSKFAHSKVIN